MIRNGMIVIALIVISQLPGMGLAATKYETSNQGHAGGVDEDVSEFAGIQDQEAVPTAPQQINPLYFRGLLNKPWWNKESASRVPLVLFEPAGLRRFNTPVVIRYDFPDETDPQTIRVVTPWGEEIPSQCRVIEKDKGIVEVVFLQSFWPYEHVPIFIYFGGRPPAPQGQTTDLKRSEDERGYYASNDLIEARFSKRGVSGRHPYITLLRGRGNPTGNQLSTLGGTALEGQANCLYALNNIKFYNLTNDDWKCDAPVIEEGPARISVRYEGNYKGTNVTLTYTLYSQSPILHYAIEAECPLTIETRTYWMPGIGLPADVYYAATQGIQRITMTKAGPVTNNLSANLAAAMSEGWYAIKDQATGQMVGELFQKERTPGMELYAHGSCGYRPTITRKLPVQGAFAPMTRGMLGTLREMTRAEQSPPAVFAAAIQPNTGVTASPPVFGTNLLMSIDYSYSWLQAATAFPEEPAKLIPHFLREQQRRHCNTVSFSAGAPFWKSRWEKEPRNTPFLETLVKDAHQSGLAVGLYIIPALRTYYNPPVTNSYGSNEPNAEKYLCQVKYRDLYVQAAQELAPYDLDVLSLEDEAKVFVQSQEAAAEFRKRYNMELVPGHERNLDLKRLSEPAYYNTFFYKMDVMTECFRDEVEAFRKTNGKTVLTHITNPRKLGTLSLGMYHDLERQMDFLDTVCTDLYGPPLVFQKFMIKYFRGLADNDKPIVLYTGCTLDPRIFVANNRYLLMWGAGALFAFGGNPALSPRLANETMSQIYGYLDYTGVGDMLVQCKPMKHMAVLRDREAFLDNIRTGATVDGGALHEKRLRSIACLPQAQADVVFSRYFSINTLRPYKILWLCDSPVFSEEQTRTVETFVNEGGCVVVEGEIIRNPILQKLCRITPTGKTEKQSVKGKQANTGAAFTFNGPWTPVKNEGGETLAALDDGKPAILAIKVGKGTILYSAMALSDRIDQDAPLRQMILGILAAQAGPFPVQIASEFKDEIESNLLSDGTRFLLALYNPKKQAVKLTASLRTAPTGTPVVVDLGTGEQRPYQPELALTLEPGQIAYYYIGPADKIAPPPATKL